MPFNTAENFLSLVVPIITENSQKVNDRVAFERFITTSDKSLVSHVRGLSPLWMGMWMRNVNSNLVRRVNL